MSAQSLRWQPERPRLRVRRLVPAWLASALGLLLAAGVVPGAEVRGFGGAVAVAALVAVLNTLLPPVVAALRLPFTVAIGFVLRDRATAVEIAGHDARLPDHPAPAVD